MTRKGSVMNATVEEFSANVGQEESTQTVTRQFKRASRRGILGMTDMGFTVLILVGLLAALTLTFLGVRGNMRDNSTAQLLSQMVGNVEASFANTNSYDSGNLLTLLDAGGYIPASARTVDGDGNVGMVTPLGTAVTITGSGGANYTITLAALPDKTCVKLLENAVGFSASPLSGVSLGGTAQTLPLTKANIAAGCTGGSTDVAVTY